MSKTLNKDFYSDLPGMVCVYLEDFIQKYGDKEGFSEAWERYRQHIKTSTMDEMLMPGSFFKDIISKGEEEE